MKNGFDDAYVINDRFFLCKGFKNSILYDTDSSRLLHIKTSLYDLVKNSELKLIPKTVLDLLGEKINIVSAEDYYNKFLAQEELNTVFLDITSYCNLRCKKCFSYKSNTSQHMSIELLKAISNISNKNKINLVILGGEPLLFPQKELFEFITIWSKEFQQVVVFTNAFYFDENFAIFFKKHNVKVKFTLYSLNSIKHDNYVGKEGAYLQVMASVNLSNSLGLNYGLNLILDYEEYGIDKKNIVDNLPIAIEEEQIFIDLIKPNKEEIACVKEYSDIFTNTLKQKRPIKHKKIQKIIQDLSNHSCHCGKIAISTNGVISICPWNKIREVSSMSFFNISDLKKDWLSPLSSNYSECKICEFRGLCFDCSYINQTIYSKVDKLAFCKYNPRTGVMEC